MTIKQSVLDAIITLENMVQTRWIRRIMLICPDDKQCVTASNILSSMNYMVETILFEDIDKKTDKYKISIDRLEKGLSNVLVTTGNVSRMIQKRDNNSLKFDVVL